MSLKSRPLPGTPWRRSWSTHVCVPKAIKSSRILGFDDLGMEAIYEFEVEDMPVTVAVDAKGTSVHHTGPKEWQAKIQSRIAGVPILT